MKIEVLICVHDENHEILFEVIDSYLIAFPHDEIAINFDYTDSYTKDRVGERYKQIKTYETAFGNLSKVINSHASISDSDIIVRADGDDLCLPNRRSVIVENLRFDWDILHTSALFYDGKNLFKRLQMLRTAFYLSYGINPIVHPTVVYRTAFLRAYPYPIRPGLEDLAHWLTLPRSTRIRRDPRPTVRYTMGSKRNPTPFFHTHRGIISILLRSTIRLWPL